MEGITGHTTGHQGHRTTDEYGNPINQGGGFGDFSTNGTGTGVTTGYATGTAGAHATPLGGGVGGYGHEGQQQLHHGGAGGGTGMLHRTDSSSSSEDDGLGGRRKKKGITEKIKEKLPGGGHRSDQMTSTTTPGAYVYDGNQHGHVHGHGQEKKGMMEKIKDKLPGHNA